MKQRYPNNAGSQNTFNNHAHRQSNRRQRNNRGSLSAKLIVFCLLIVAVAVIFFAIAANNNGKSAETVGSSETVPTNVATSTENLPSSQEAVNPPVVDTSYTEITLLSTGDVMYHNPQLDAALNYATGVYEFDNCYKYIKDIVSAADYAVVNFESTTAGDEWGGYAGYPVFNTPDSGLKALVDIGFDMMLFANNHCYDTGSYGLKRTQEMFDKLGVDYIGARKSTGDKTYKLVDVNGVKLGLLNSTDDLAWGNIEKRYINGIEIKNEDIPLIDLFNHSLMDQFYSDAQMKIGDLKDSGADIIIYYIHWGLEYYLEHNDLQGEIAHRLCDMGVDVIIGGHPHMIQDTDILTSSNDSNHKTLCFYSLGNLISNQNRLTMGTLKTGVDSSYTENGLMVELTIRKYASGECIVSAVETIPLWVHRYYSSVNNKMTYEVVPLSQALASPSEYGLYNSDFGISHGMSALSMTETTLKNIESVFASQVVLPYKE